jgi:hypothetical protein
MIAARYLKYAPGIRKDSLLHILYPGAVHGQRNMILRLACDCAGMAPNALAIVNNKAVSHSNLGFAPRI